MTSFPTLSPSTAFHHGSADRSSLLAVLSLLVALGAPSAPAQANTFDEIDIGTRIIDADHVRGPKWTRLEFEPMTTGSHVISVVSSSDADIRLSVFRKSDDWDDEDGLRIGSTSGSDAPRRWEGVLDKSKHYYIGVWASEGSAEFTANIKAVPTPKTLADLSTSPMESWQVKGVANAVLTAGDVLFVGGDFTAVYNTDGASFPRSHLTGIDRETGEPTSFSPMLDGPVYALELSPDEKTLYVGGAFRKAEGKSRKYIAAYDVATGELTDFDPPSPNKALRSIAVDGDKVYIAGLFKKIGGERRDHVAALEAGTGALDPKFDVSVNGKVRALLMGVDRLWIGGEFTKVGGVRQRGIGAVDPVDGSRQATDDVAYPVIALSASDSRLFIAGGGPGGRAAAFSRVTGTELWEISSDGNFQAVDHDGGRFVYFGGHYEKIEGNPDIDRLTRHYVESGKTDVSWLPRVNGMRSINAIDVTSDGINIGGDFTKVDGDRHRGFAIIPGQTR